MEESDLYTDSWRNLAPVPQEVDHPAVANLDVLVYSVDGLDRRWALLETYEPMARKQTHGRPGLPCPRPEAH